MVALFFSAVAGLLTSSALSSWRFLPGAVLGPLFLFLAHERRPRSFALGYLYGLALLGSQLHWMSAFRWFAPWATVAILALPYGLALRFSASSALPFAAALTAAEFVRTVGAFALPWGLLGTAVIETPLEAELLGRLGVSGVTFLILLSSSLVSSRFRGGRPAVMALVALTAFGFLAPLGVGFSGAPVKFGVVQGGFRQDEDFEFRPRLVLEKLLGETERLSAQGAEVVVWTETVILEYLNRSSSLRDEIESFAISHRVSILCGAPALLPGEEKRNSVFVFSSDGRKRYDKYHLVPFGEYVPFLGPDREHRILPEGTGDFSPSLAPFRVDRHGLMVCYEGAFGYLSRSLARQGAGFLVNVTNDAWAWSGEEAWQHYALSRARAAEAGRPLVRAANVGVSALVSPREALDSRLGPYESGVLTASIRPISGLTPIARWGEFVGWLSLLGFPFLLTIQALDREDELRDGSDSDILDEYQRGAPTRG